MKFFIVQFIKINISFRYRIINYFWNWYKKSEEKDNPWKHINKNKELNVYDDIADAMAEAATQVGVPICWGAAWGTPEMPYPMDIRNWEGSMEEAMNAYIDLRRSQGRRPFMDGPHFELIS